MTHGASLRDRAGGPTDLSRQGVSAEGAHPLRTCATCRHYLPPYMEPARCRRPLSDRLDIVTGHLAERVQSSCWRERKPGRTFWTGREKCGPEAKFWEGLP